MHSKNGRGNKSFEDSAGWNCLGVGDERALIFCFTLCFISGLLQHGGWLSNVPERERVRPEISKFQILKNCSCFPFGVLRLSFVSLGSVHLTHNRASLSPPFTVAHTGGRLFDLYILCFSMSFASCRATLATAGAELSLCRQQPPRISPALGENMTHLERDKSSL